MFAIMVNSIVIIIGCIVGLFIKGGITDRISNTIIKSLGLCFLYIGISKTFEGNNMLITMISMVIGALVGELIDIDNRLNKLGEFIEAKFNEKRSKKASEESCIEIDDEYSKVSISEGFIASSLLFCVGAMANNTTIFTKSVIVGISSIIFTASLGIGVIFSAISVFIYQGLITIGSSVLSGILSEVVISAMTSTGSLLIIGLGLNMLEVTKIKIANILPAVFIPIIFGLIGIL